MGLKSSQGYLAKPAPGLGYLPEGREPSVNLHRPDLHRAVSTQRGVDIHSQSGMYTSKSPQHSFSIGAEGPPTPSPRRYNPALLTGSWPQRSPALAHGAPCLLGHLLARFPLGQGCLW